MIKISQATLFAATVTTGLIAGLFYSWTVSVTPGLAKLNDKAYLEAFQALNKAILNPAFFVTFLGTLFLLPLAAWTNYSSGSYKFYLLLTASGCYMVGVFGITVIGNVPMNEVLASFDTSTASLNDTTSTRVAFEGRWNLLNTLRTLFACCALILTVIACLSPNESKS